MVRGQSGQAFSSGYARVRFVVDFTETLDRHVGVDLSRG